MARQHLATGTGGPNIDAARIGGDKERLEAKFTSVRNAGPRENSVYGNDARARSGGNTKPHDLGRWPANVVHDRRQEATLRFPVDAGASSARFFYSAKANKAEKVGTDHPIGQEAASLAGHLGLGPINPLYDDNGIPIDGKTNLSFTENTAQKFDALAAVQPLRPVDCTTNPSLVLAALKDPASEELVSKELAACRIAGKGAEDAAATLTVAIGAELSKLVPGRVSTEVDACLGARMQRPAGEEDPNTRPIFVLKRSESHLRL